MHAIQTSGNCIRNVTADHFAGAAEDEIEDPRPYAEILRQWSSVHPEFTFLPRKFKIAVTGAPKDRAAIQVHDIGYQIVRNEQGEIGFAVYVGGGQGRTPMVASKIRDFLPVGDLFAYSEAILRVYNLEGRRDNKYKARIKILVHEKGAATIRAAVEAEFAARRERRCSNCRRPKSRASAPISRRPILTPRAPTRPLVERAAHRTSDFAAFLATNVARHKVPGYAHRDDFAEADRRHSGRCDRRADGSRRRSRRSAIGQDEIRVSHEQNLVLPHVALDDLPALYDASPRTVLRPPMPASSPTSSPARASIIARSRPRARSRSRSAFPNVSAKPRGRARSAT